VGRSELGAVTALIERDEELALFRQVAAGAMAGHAAVVEIAGPPGLGRTSLVEAAVTHAKSAGLRVQRARGSPAEASLSGGVVSELLAGLAPASAGGDLVPGEPSAPPAALGQTVVAAAWQTPMMLALDDAHWSDEYSLRWLLALLRRASEAPLLIVFAAGRWGQAREAMMADVRARAVDAGVDWHVLRPSRLSISGVRRLLAEAGQAEPEDGFVDAAMLKTGGLPALFRSVAEALRRGELVATAEQLPSFDACLRVDVFDWADEMTSELSRDELALLRAIVVCGDDLGWELVVSLARLRSGTGSRTVGMLRAQGALIGGTPPRLLCPFTRERVLAQMTRPEREELFARAAELGHRAAIGTSGLARLLLSAPTVGQPWAVDALREDAARADSAGQSETAARLLARALQEPVDEVSRARLLTELASVEMLHAPEQSDLRLAQVLDGPGPQRIAPVRVHAADLLLAKGNTELLQHAVTGALTSQDLSAADRAALEALYWLAVDGPHDAPPPARPPPPLPEQPSDPAQSAAVAWQLLVRGQDLARTRALARAALAVGAGHEAPLSPRIIASRILLLVDDMAAAEAGLDAVLVDARQRRARSAAALARLIRANFGIRNGHLDDACDDLERALALLPLQCWHPMAQPGVLAVQMTLYLEAGRLDRAEGLLAAELPPGVESGLGWSQFLLAKGVFWLLAGEPGIAVEHLREAGRRMLARQWVNPALASWRSFAALAHRACGNTAEAERLVTEERALAERWGSPSALGDAYLAASMVLEGQAGWDSLSAAVEVLRDSPSRLRYAKALLQMAVMRREAGESGEAVRLATEAGELAMAHRARGLVNQARELGWDPLRRF
jgi:hypothetical protein